MAKGNNNIRNKKPHSSKPYDVSNSFVKKVTSGVTSLLPQGSWLTRWFISDSTPVEGTQPATNVDHDNEHVSHSPPTKRARIPLNRPFPANSFRVSSPIDRGETHPWPSESVASPIPNVFSDSPVPGPSGLSRTPVAPGPFQTPSTNAEGLEGKINGDGGSDSSESTSGCSSLAPQRATSSGTTAVHRTSRDCKMANHMPSYSLFPSTLHKLSPSVNPSLSRRRPSFNVSSFGSPNLDSSKLSRESSFNSPFYIGRTIFGGASAYRRPREGASSESFFSSTRRGGVTVRPANEKSQTSASAETSMSQTARRILEALEQFSSPVSEARRMPLPPQPPLSVKRKRQFESMSNSPAQSVAPTAITNPLTIPMPPERLRLHRLQDATEAARRIASSVSGVGSQYTLRSDGDNHPAGTGKVTKSKPLDEDELLLPVNLPNVSLPITTLPSFELFPSQVQPTNTNSRTCTTKITSKLSAASAESSDKDGDKNKTLRVVSTSSSFVNTSSNVNLSAAPNSGMKPTNFLHAKSSAGVSKFKIDAAHADASYAECGRKSEISSGPPNMFSNPSKSNPKSVSFSGTFPYVNNPGNPKDQIEISNSSRSSDVHRASAVSTFVVKGALFSNAYADCDNTSTTNDFAFSTPTVLSTTRLKDNTEMQKDIFDFSKPQLLDCSKYDGKCKRNEPNGFHALHSSSKVDRTHDSPVVNTAYKEGSEKISVCKDNKSDKSTGTTKNTASGGKENKGWAAKFSTPNSWECSSCLVRNNNDVKVCVCCGGKTPLMSDSVSDDAEKKKSALPSTVGFPSPGWGTKYALQPGMWECSVCMVRNKANDTNCVSCTTVKSGTNKSATQSDWGSQFRLNAGMWECSACLVRNKEQDIKCVSCTTPRSDNTSEEKSNVKNIETKPGNDWGQKFMKPSSSWECPVCLIVNKDMSLKCAACQEPKPGMDTNRSSTGGSIKFNFDMPSDASSFKFGIDKAEVKQPEGNSALFSFGGSSKKETGSLPGQANFVFGTNSSESKLPAGVKFGVSSQDKGSINEKSDAKAGESVVTTTSTPTVPASSGTFPQTSQRTSLQSDNSKVVGFTFGVPVSSSSNSGESKKSGINLTESSQKDFKFGVTQASPTLINAGETDKRGGTFAVPLSKSEQKIAAEAKPTFSFNTSSAAPAAPAAAAAAAAAAVTSTTASFSAATATSTTAATTAAPTTTPTTTTTTGTIVASKSDTFSFSSNITPASPAVSTTIVTTTAAVTVPVSSSSAPVFSFGSNATSFKPAVSTPGFSFGGSGVQTTSNGIFGANRSSQFKSSGDGLFSNKAPASTISLFGGSPATSKNPSLPSFGTTVGVSPTTSSTTVTTTAAAAAAAATNTTTTATTVAKTTTVITSTSTLTKSATTSVPTFNTPTGPVFASLNSTTSKTFASGITKPTFANATNSFGSDTTTSAATTTAATAISATTASTTVSTSGTASTPAPSFGLQGASTASFGVPVTVSSFSTSISTFGGSATSGFGISTTTAPGAIPPSAPTPKFGTTSCVPFGGATTTGNVFGTVTASQSFSTASPSVFGAGNTANFGSPSTTPAFGSGPGASNFGSSFGGASTTAPTFGTASSVTTVSSATNLPVFGAFQTSAKPSQGLFMFGSNPPTTAQSSNFSFNVASQAGGTQAASSGTTAFSFGSGAASSATNVTTSTHTTPTAAATPVAATAPAAGFGAFSFTGNAAAASAPSLFANTAPAAPVFGSPSVPPTAPSGPSFGAGSSNNAGVFRPPTFNFGSGGTQPPFAFGSSVQSGAVQSTGSSGFSFGQGQPPAQSQPLQFNPNVRPTFNFTGGETPQFTASAQSSTPTPQRRVKKAVRRALR